MAKPSRYNFINNNYVEFKEKFDVHKVRIEDLLMKLNNFPGLDVTQEEGKYKFKNSTSKPYELCFENFTLKIPPGETRVVKPK